MKRVHNYNAGPAALPLEALERAQKELLDLDNSGMSAMEISHRSKEYEKVHNEASSLVRELLTVPENYKVLWLYGGASLQFAMAPMNVLAPGKSADYINTGYWAKKAFKEAKLVGAARWAGSSEDKGFTYIPTKLDLDPKAEYVHVTSNNTIEGTQWTTFPAVDAPLFADMSSDIMWRPFDVKPFGLIYAGAQKNLGPAGVALVIIRDDVLAKCNANLPSMLQYATHAKENSLYNTPPCFSIYMVRNVLAWVKNQGGLPAMEKQNKEKGKLLYGAIDASGGFYKNPIDPASRSVMNVVFRLPSEELEAKMVSEGKAAGFIGLKGHRSVGGIRVSMYNAASVASITDLVAFMKEFQKKNG